MRQRIQYTNVKTKDFFFPVQQWFNMCRVRKKRRISAIFGNEMQKKPKNRKKVKLHLKIL